MSSIAYQINLILTRARKWKDKASYNSYKWRESKKAIKSRDITIANLRAKTSALKYRHEQDKQDFKNQLDKIKKMNDEEMAALKNQIDQLNEEKKTTGYVTYT